MTEVETGGIFPTAVSDTLVGKSSRTNTSSSTFEENEEMNKNLQNEKTETDSIEITGEEASEESNATLEVHSQENSPRQDILKDKITHPILKPQNNNDKSKTTQLSRNNKVPKTPNARTSKFRKTQSMDQSRKNKRTMNYREVHEEVPNKVKNNPYIMKRLNTVPENPPKPPRAALPKEEYRPKPEIVIDDYTQSLIDKKPLDIEPTIEQLQASSYQLRNLEKDLVDKSDYKEAKKAAEAHDYVAAKLKRETAIKDSKATIEDLISKRNELCALVEHLNLYYEDLIQQHQEEFSQKASAMREQQQSELDKFDEETPSELQPEFKRYSVTLLKMRSEEKNLALNRKFDEAIAKKAKADKLQKQEEQLNHEKMDDYYRLKKLRMMEKHNKVMETFTQFNESRINEILGQRKKQIEPLQARIESYEKMIADLCEKRNIKSKHLNFDAIDDERLERLKTASQSRSPSAPRTQSAMSRTVSKSNPVVKPKVASQTK